MIGRFLVVLTFVFTGILSLSGQNNDEKIYIQLFTGDLIFCDATSGTLSKSIDQSTQTGKATHFDHVGMIVIDADTIWVYHAAPKKGVCREVLTEFLSGDRIKSSVYRLKPEYKASIPQAIKKANSYLGLPYKFSYRLNDPGLYCSEFIYKIFSADSIFSLNPMTFTDKKTGKILPGWSTHYAKLGIPVPEGEPGCNPNGLAASDKLELIGPVKVTIK